MFRRILVPLDGSDTAARGLDTAFAIARAFDASLVFLHVIEHPAMVADVGLPLDWAQFSATLREHGRRVLDAAHQAASAAGIASEARMVDAVTARVGDVIVEQAAEARCDLVVIGSQGRRGVERVLLGSDAERVVRLSPVPVLVARGKAAA